MSSQSKPAAPEPSEIAGRYEILAKLGAGAMGTVYKAKDRMLGREVAIKTIRFESMAASGTGYDELLERFKREARVAAQLKHPNIVTIHDIGESEGLSYLAMEFIDGKGLETIIAEGKMPVGRAAGLAAQVADALGYAYEERGVVHRDIKPANIMIEAGERVKVTDFGIAKPLDSAEQLTQTGGVLGTPSYMSPEQARGRKVDGRSDLFSVGCVLYEMLSGRKAFTGDNITGILLKIISEPPTPIRELNPLLTDETVHIVEKALSKDPETRYQSGRDLADDLLTLAQPGHVPTLRQADADTHPLADLDAPTVSSAPTATRPGAAGAAPPPLPPTQVTPETVVPPPPTAADAPARVSPPRRPTAAPARRRPEARGGGGRALAIGGAVALLAVIGVGGWFVFGRGGPEPSHDPFVEHPLVAEMTPAPTAEATPAASAAEPRAAAQPVPAAPAPAPAAVASRATPAPRADAAPPRPAPVAAEPATRAAAPPPPEPAPPRPDDFLDELPQEERPDGRAAAQALAEGYRSGSDSGSGFGASGQFRRRPRIPRHTPAEQPAVRALAWILSAQNAHLRRTGRYGNLDELVASGDLPLAGERSGDGFVRRQYRFTVTAAGDSFRADAHPLSPRGRPFYVDDAGYVMVTDD